METIINVLLKNKMHTFVFCLPCQHNYAMQLSIGKFHATHLALLGHVVFGTLLWLQIAIAIANLRL